MVKVLGVRLSPVGDDVVVSYKAQRSKKTRFASEVIVSMKDGKKLKKSLDVDLMKWDNGKPITWSDWEKGIGYEKWYKFGIGTLVGRIKEITIRINDEEIHFVPSDNDNCFVRVE